MLKFKKCQKTVTKVHNSSKDKRYKGVRKIMYNAFNDDLTYERHHEDTEEDPEGVAEDVHHHDGEQGHRQVGLTPPLVILTTTQDL